ncbi:MAG: C-type lectin domain-containing protein [Cyanobacteriota bacterium]
MKLTLKLSIATATALISLGIGRAAQASILTNPTTGNLYFLTESRSSWTEAQAEAVSKGGNLVAINNTEEQKWLLDVFGSTELFWIGFTDQEAEGAWKWANGEKVTYTNWTPNEPNNAKFFVGGQYLGSENYAVMNWQANGRWNDVHNTYLKARGIVEVVKAFIPKLPSIPGAGSDIACYPNS